MTVRAWGKRNMYRQSVVKVASYLVSLSVGVSRSRNMDRLGAADSLWERLCRPSSAGVGSIIVAQSNLSSLLQFSVLDVSVKFDARPHNACSNLDKFATTPVICWLSIWHCITLFWCVLLDLFVFFCSLLINVRLSFFKPLPQIIVWLLVRSCMGVTNSVAKSCQLEWKVKSKTIESHRLCQQYWIYNDTYFIDPGRFLRKLKKEKYEILSKQSDVENHRELLSAAARFQWHKQAIFIYLAGISLLGKNCILRWVEISQ